MYVSTYLRKERTIMKKKRTRLTKEERQEQILTAAINVFVKKGYNGATTLEIAKAANISEVTLFRHFASKKEIFKLSIEPIIFKTLEETIIASKELTAKEQLEYILTERIKLVSKNHKVIQLLLMESKINSELEEINYIERIYKLLEKAIVSIGITVKDDKFTTRLLMGSLLSFLYLPEYDEKLICDFVKQIINSITID